MTQWSVCGIAAMVLLLIAAQSRAIPPETLPSARTPTNFEATVVSATQVDLTCTGGADEFAYFVARCKGARCVSFVQIGTGDVLGYQDKSVVSATSYSYRVRARGRAGNPYSANTLTVTTPDTTAPSSPANLTASDNVSVAGYQLERCTGQKISRLQ